MSTDESFHNDGSGSGVVGDGASGADSREVQSDEKQFRASRELCGETQFTIEFTGDGRRRRHHYVDRPDGDGWFRYHEERRGCSWRPVGREPVSGVRVFGTIPGAERGTWAGDGE